MSEWWTYSLSDFLLFSPRTYYRLFELYNTAIWPLQIVGLALGAAILGLLLREVAWRGRAIAAMLAACWLWVAWAYFLKRYETINWAAEYFAVGFAIEALLLVWSGIVHDRLRFRSSRDLIGLAALCIFLFALFVFPLIGPLIGRPWLQVELFGVAPDPTAIATTGVLVAARRPHWELLVIPLIWCAISGATLWTMQSPDAPVVPVVAVLVLVLVGWKTLRPRLPSPHEASCHPFESDQQ
jgi:hypothetical protein